MLFKVMRSDEMTKGEGRDKRREDNKTETQSTAIRNQEAKKELKRKLRKNSHDIGQNPERCGILEPREEIV